MNTAIALILLLSAAGCAQAGRSSNSTSFDFSCLSGASKLQSLRGDKWIQDVKVGEQVRSVDQEGNLHYSEILQFLHHEAGKKGAEFLRIHTDSMPHRLQLDLTHNHLLFVGEDRRAVFAKDVKVGDEVLVEGDVGGEAMRQMQRARVIKVEKIKGDGVFAPLTAHGSVVVNGVQASCYALLNNHHAAHWSQTPVRLAHQLMHATVQPAAQAAGGIVWWSKLLFAASQMMPLPGDLKLQF